MSDLAWLEWRRHGLGGSDIGAILGLSKWGSPYTVWASKCIADHQSERTERQQIGIDLEVAIAAMFTRHTGLQVAGEQLMCEHPVDGWRRCTVDGFAFDGPDHALDLALGPVQMKSDGAFGWPEGPPASYVAQVRWEMGVTGHDRGWLAVLFAGFRFEAFEILQDAAELAYMVDQAAELWHGHCVTGIPPAVDGSDATTDLIRSMFPDTQDGGTVEVDARLVEEWVALRDERLDQEAVVKELKERQQAIENELRLALGDAEVATVDGLAALTCRTQTRTTVNADLLRADYPEAFEATRRETSTRIMRPASKAKQRAA